MQKNKVIKKQRINYISHGKYVTGGYLHEKQFAEAALTRLGNDKYELHIFRQWRHFEGILSQLFLLFWAFRKANGNITISVARLGIPVILRNIFNEHKTYIVWHYYSEEDEKSWFLKIWYKLFIFIARHVSEKKLEIVCVAPYWMDFFSQQLGLRNLLYYPNYFNKSNYSEFIGSQKQKKIHFGQVSTKNDTQLFKLAERLHAQGYTCYFSTNVAEKAGKFPFYENKYFAHFDDYLIEMASSAYTLAFPGFAEGWNRVAHESFLVGTQVIGKKLGGLGDLLSGANGHIVASMEEAEAIIINQVVQPINAHFLDKFVENVV